MKLLIACLSILLFSCYESEPSAHHYTGTNSISLECRDTLGQEILTTLVITFDVNGYQSEKIARVTYVFADNSAIACINPQYKGF